METLRNLILVSTSIKYYSLFSIHFSLNRMETLRNLILVSTSIKYYSLFSIHFSLNYNLLSVLYVNSWLEVIAVNRTTIQVVNR